MPFYMYRQNNSGGSFDVDAESGISVVVIIEAPNAEFADLRAEYIGLYFNGCESGRDCSCCGDRWSAQWGDDGDDVPMYYGKKIEPDSPMPDDEPGWRTNGEPMVFIHYADGTFKPAYIPQ